MIREETALDHPSVRRVITSAFGNVAEAQLVDALRHQALPVVSLVAETEGAIVGHIMFSPVTLSGHPEMKLMGLAPLAVTPAQQRTGVGSALAHAGLERCRRLGALAAVVLGDPVYYSRLGFVPARRFGIDCDYPGSDDAFMAIELVTGALGAASGRAHYHAAFGEL